MGSSCCMPNVRARLWLIDVSIFLIPVFPACAVACFAVRLATYLDSSDIVFVSSATDVLSASVAVVRFSRSALACALCTCAT